jgi:hypothetical protein
MPGSEPLPGSHAYAERRIFTYSAFSSDFDRRLRGKSTSFNHFDRLGAALAVSSADG